MLAIGLLEADVNNGGIDQYYFNSSGDHALFVPHALRKIGASSTAGIVDRANALFGRGGPPAHRDVRQSALERFREAQPDGWEALDDEFYRYPDDIHSLVVEYVRKNAR